MLINLQLKSLNIKVNSQYSISTLSLLYSIKVFSLLVPFLLHISVEFPNVVVDFVQVVADEQLDVWMLPLRTLVIPVVVGPSIEVPTGRKMVGHEFFLKSVNFFLLDVFSGSDSLLLGGLTSTCLENVTHEFLALLRVRDVAAVD